MFYKSNATGYKQVLKGIKLETLVYGDKALFTEFRRKGKPVARPCPSS